MPRIGFFVRATGIVALAHAYVGWRLLPALPLGGYGLAAGILGLLLSCLLIPVGFRARSFKRGSLSDALAWAGLLAMGLFSSLFVLTLLRDAVFLAAALVPSGEWLARYRALSAEGVPLLAAAATLVGLFNARRCARVVDVAVPIASLPPALHGFTIVQLSDIHIGPTIKRDYLAAIVDHVNALEADLIAITGDLIDGTVAELAAHTEPLARLSARHGSFFVTGNHEYYSGAHAWIRELRRLGLRVLVNEHVILERCGASLVVAGVTDYSAHLFDPGHRSDPVAALAGAPADAAARILLAHQPRSAAQAARAGFDLQISGHTHGGQFLPWNFFVRLQQPFTAGLHRFGELWVYTSRGTGYWGPPKRLGAPSEITRLRLVPAAPQGRTHAAASRIGGTPIPSATS